MIAVLLCDDTNEMSHTIRSDCSLTLSTSLKASVYRSASHSDQSGTWAGRAEQSHSVASSHESAQPRTKAALLALRHRRPLSTGELHVTHLHANQIEAMTNIAVTRHVKHGIPCPTSNAFTSHETFSSQRDRDSKMTYNRESICFLHRECG